MLRYVGTEESDKKKLFGLLGITVGLFVDNLIDTVVHINKFLCILLLLLQTATIGISVTDILRLAGLNHIGLNGVGWISFSFEQEQIQQGHQDNSDEFGFD